MPDSVRQNWESPEAIVTLVRGRMQTTGPTTAEALGEKLAMEPSRVFAALEAIEAEGTVMRGRFTPSTEVSNQSLGTCKLEPMGALVGKPPVAPSRWSPWQRIPSNGANAAYSPASTAGRSMACVARFSRSNRPTLFAF